MKVENRIDWIVQRCKGKDVLDVGCVGGENSYKDADWLHGAIREHAKTILGIDNNLKAVRKLQKLGYNTKYADAENFDLHRKFDVLIGGELIEHLNNPGLFLGCARRHLRKNGYLVLTTPNARHPNLWSRDGIKEMETHVSLYAMQLLKQLLSRHGFNVVKEQYLEGRPTSLKGKLYVKLLRFSPKWALTLGVVAEKRKR